MLPISNGMNIDQNKFSLALAGTFGVIYVLCAALVALAPGVALKLLGWVTHIVNVDKFAGDVEITAVGLIVGLIQILAYSYLAARLFSFFYNRLTKEV